MLGSTFYHSLTRKYVIMFGNCFNDITIRKLDANKNIVKSILVPISYGPKRKWVVALDHDLSSISRDREVAIQLPRMSFFFNSIQPDMGRMLSTLNKVTHKTSNQNEMYSSFQPIPYKIQAELCIYAKSHDDSAQIVEQIIPYFAPDFTNSMNLIPELQRPMDIVTRLTGITQEDIWDGDFTKRQAVLYTIDFEIDAWFYGPVQRSGVIKRVQIDIGIPSGGGPVTAEDIAKTPRTIRMTTTPGLTSTGQPTTIKEESIPYSEIEADDDYGFVEELEEFNDGYRYDPVTDTDKPIK